MDFLVLGNRVFEANAGYLRRKIAGGERGDELGQAWGEEVGAKGRKQIEGDMGT